MLRKLFDAGSHTPIASFGLLLLRVSAGLMLAAGHGWGKLVGFAEKAATFADPLGIGSHASMAGAIGGELVFPALVVLGWGTRFAAIPPAFTMAVAAFMIHADDPWRRKELAVLFMVSFLVLVFTGAGSHSLDAMVGTKKRR
jgi:putative oxidoreductase